MSSSAAKKRPLRPDEFWAVRDVSFDIEPGDSFALVGRNGSGKTTLLKMMNGLIKPDTGEIRMLRPVQALINLGTGFNPNLSGRDNVYNAASLMGLNRRETTAILDEVIAFSELEQFIDSPFQTYSSGMKARLGFAVAVHLAPEILLIDEILSVGDYAFQNKCFVKDAGPQEGRAHHRSRLAQPHPGHAALRARPLDPPRRPQGDRPQPRHRHLVPQLPRHGRGRPRRGGGGEARSEAGTSSTAPSTRRTNIAARCAFEILHAGAPRPFPCPCMVMSRSAMRSPWPNAAHDLNVTLNLYREDGVLAACISTLRGNLLKESPPGEVRPRSACAI
jgi:ABC-type transport system involved in cytochrome c biogenesis ATPase subunit